MATGIDTAAYLEKLLVQGCELLERLHANSVKRRRPGTPTEEMVEMPDPETATRDQIENWTNQCLRYLDGDMYSHPLRELHEERDDLCFELMCLEGFIEDYLTRYLARWVNQLPESARKSVFDTERLILAYSGREKRWEAELKMWERGDWEGLLRNGYIEPHEYFVLARDYPKGNPKFPQASTLHDPAPADQAAEVAPTKTARKRQGPKVK